MIDKELHDKQSLEFKKFFNHYLDKRKEIMKITHFKVEDVFGGIVSKDSISPEHRTKL